MARSTSTNSIDPKELERLTEMIVKVYNHLYIKITGNKRFKLDLSVQKQDVQINNFIKKLNEHYKGSQSLSKDFVIKYLSFQFTYWLDKQIKQTNYKFSLAWMIGDKAWKRWVETKDRELSEYFTHKNLLEKFIDIRDIYTIFDKQKEEKESYVSNSRYYEESQKKKFHNTDQGLIHCLETTTLYSKCIVCTKCKYKEDCKQALQLLYPKLHKQRLKNKIEK